MNCNNCSEYKLIGNLPYCWSCVLRARCRSARIHARFLLTAIDRLVVLSSFSRIPQSFLTRDGALSHLAVFAGCASSRNAVARGWVSETGERGKTRKELSGTGRRRGHRQTATRPANFRSFQKRRGFMALSEVTRFHEFAAFGWWLWMLRADGCSRYRLSMLSARIAF